MITYYTDNTYYFELLLTDVNGNPVTSLGGSTITYTLIDSSDGSTVDSGTMSLDGNVWKASYTFNTAGEYRVEYTTPAGYDNGMDEILVLPEAESSELQNAKLNRVLGLSQENYRIFNASYSEYDGKYRMDLATIKTYSSASDCNSDTNPLATYSVEASYDSNGNMTDYKVVKQ